MTATKNKNKGEYHYWRVIVTYGDGETSGDRVFKDRERAEEWAARQKKSPVVKKAVVEPFMRDAYAPPFLPANVQPRIKRARRRRDDLSVAGQPLHFLTFLLD